LKIEPSNKKVLEMQEIIKKEIETEQLNSQDEEDSIENIVSNNMKLNEDGEYYFSDGEDYDNVSDDDKE
jgi:hypothetical protein